MDMTGKHIGLWGFGIVGKAAADYLHGKCKQLEIMDKRNLTPEEQASADRIGALVTKEQEPATIEAFITRNDYIIVSPGIDTRPYIQFKDKFVAELDLFQISYKKPIIAITGSVGKTTVTHLLSHILGSYNPHWWTGGNIGTGALDALAIQDQTDGAILEVSSFQLEQCSRFSPDLAIITNIHPNHLDRHGSLELYSQAKAKIFTHQTEDQAALIPLTLKKQLRLNQPTRGAIHFFSMTLPAEESIQELADTSILFYIDNNYIKAYNNGHIITLVAIDNLPTISFLENWLIICAVLFLSQLPVDNLKELTCNIPLPEHRLEHVTTINGIDFYNDSKGTTPAATLAAVDKLKAHPIILLLGGIGKGVDRTDMISRLKNKVKYIVCFGAEREVLAQACHTYTIPCSSTESLPEAIDLCMAQALSGDQILLSPAGASFDQFKHYQERGQCFKQYVHALRI